MTNFTLNMEDTFDGGIQDGTYETVITKFEESATQSGTEFVDVRLTIRNDIDQKYKTISYSIEFGKRKRQGNMICVSSILLVLLHITTW